MIDVLFWAGFGFMLAVQAAVLRKWWKYDETAGISVATFVFNLFFVFLCLYGALHF